MRIPYLKIFLLCLVAGAASVVANAVSPNRLPWRENWSQLIEGRALLDGITVVDLDEARRIVGEHSRVLLDARPAEDFMAGHVPGAVSLPIEDFVGAYPQVKATLRLDSPLLVYCTGTGCDESLVLAEALRQEKYTDVMIFPGGFQAWEEAKLPVEAGR